MLTRTSFLTSVACLVFASLCSGQGLDETWTLTVAGRTVQVNPDGTFRIPNIATPDQFGSGGPGTPPDFRSDDFLRVTGVSHANGVTRYAFGEPFQIRQGEVFGTFPLTITDTPPPLPTAITMSAPSSLVAVNETVQLTTTATLEDGSQQDVTPRTSWTIYRTSNPQIATVAENGLVTGRAVGSAFITAVNDGATAVKRISVTQEIQTTTIEGLVQREDGTPFDGASVTTTFDGSTTSGANGTFSIPDFQIPSEAETITVRALAEIGGEDFRGTSEMVDLIPDGITDAGIIVLRPVTAEFEDEFGSVVSLRDDDFRFVNFGFDFPFYGTNQTGVYVGSNGFLTFGAGDWDFTESISEHLRPEPRISGFFDDLYPRSGRFVYSNRLTDPNRLVVTFDRVPEYFSFGSNTFQIVLFGNGRIQMGYRGMTARDAVVGISPGGNPAFDSVDFSSLLAGRSFGSGRAVLQQFTFSSPFDLDGGFLVYEPNAGGGYDVSFIPPQNESSIGSGLLTGVATNADGSPCVGQVEVRFSCDQSYRRLCPLDNQGRYTLANAPFGGGLRVSVVGSELFGTDVIPVTANQGAINIAPINNPAKPPRE